MKIRSTALAAVAIAAAAVTWWLAHERDGPVSPRMAATEPRTAVAAEKSAPSAGPAMPLAEDVSARVCAAAAKYGDPAEREAFLESAVKGVPRAFYARLAERLGSAPAGSVENELLRAILLRWAWEEPTNVAAWAIDHPGSPVRQDALAVAAERWAKADPAQLLQWSAGLSAADRQWVLLRSGDFLGRTDPALFAVWQQALQPGREREQLDLAIAREWSQREPESVVAALSTNDGPEFAEWRRLTIAGLVNHLETMGGAAAAEFVAQKIPPGPVQDGAAIGAVVAWAREDPAAARRWIDTFASTDLRAQASQVLLGYWLESDRGAAEAFAAGLPAGAVRDQASERVAQFLATQGPNEAIAWAERISDPGKKSQALAFVLSEWERRDPEAARELMRRRPELMPAGGTGG